MSDSRGAERPKLVEPSLIERAADVYDFAAALRGRGTNEVASLQRSVADGFAPPAANVPSATVNRDPVATIDRERLSEQGFIVPERPVGQIAEEFRLVKRQLLMRTLEGEAQSARDRTIMICSAQPGEGKTFCAVNLALSLATERDTEVLLVDADVAKPQVLATLGIASSPGLIDAICAETRSVEDFVVRTDVPKLSILPSGTATRADTELLSSGRGAAVLEQLAASNPRRIVILDSAPALAASPAAVLAHRVGRILMVVRADRTTEAELRDAIALLDGCPDIALLLNGTSFFATNRTYGSYHGDAS